MYLLTNLCANFVLDQVTSSKKCSELLKECFFERIFLGKIQIAMTVIDRRVQSMVCDLHTVKGDCFETLLLVSRHAGKQTEVTFMPSLLSGQANILTGCRLTDCLAG